MLPKSGAVVVVSSTYNGTPPDNASGFAKWLDEQKEGEWRRGRMAGGRLYMWCVCGCCWPLLTCWR